MLHTRVVAMNITFWGVALGVHIASFSTCCAAGGEGEGEGKGVETGIVEYSITYELQEGSEFFHGTQGEDGQWITARVAVTGTFEALITQSSAGSDARIFGMAVESRGDQSYRITGHGWYQLRSLYQRVGGFPATQSTQLWIDVNGRGPFVLIQPELFLAVTFPVTWLSIAGASGGNEYFGLDFVAQPVESDFKRFFMRGDANEDGVFSISDPISVLLFLFGDAAAPLCLDAADSNDDGIVDIEDISAMLQYLFMGGTNVAPLWHMCCVDVTVDSLNCHGQEPCRMDPRDAFGIPDPE